MKLSNLWFYYFNAGGQPRRQEVDTSRQYPLSFHAYVELTPLWAGAQPLRPVTIAASVAVASSLTSNVVLTQQRAHANVVGFVPTSHIVPALRNIRAVARAHARGFGLSSHSDLGVTRNRANAVATGIVLSMRLPRQGMASVDVGPDLEAEELEELLFLLEVA